VDFSACQLRLAHGVLGLPDPLCGKIRTGRDDADLYAVAGVERAAVKLAVLIMINAGNRQSAEKALAQKLYIEGMLPAGANFQDEARNALDAVVRHFSTLDTLWFTDLGLRLQRIDADICAKIQQALRSRGIPVLSVHDSFIVASPHHETLETEMKSVFEWGMEEARQVRIPRSALSR
jgi:hypothetical protein